jgi:hypothetical protein
LFRACDAIFHPRVGNGVRDLLGARVGRDDMVNVPREADCSLTVAGRSVPCEIARGRV